MNFLPLYITYPSWIHPEVFPGVPMLGLIRWYGLMYICAFTTAFWVLKKLLCVLTPSTEMIFVEDDHIPVFCMDKFILDFDSAVFVRSEKVLEGTKDNDWF